MTDRSRRVNVRVTFKGGNREAGGQAVRWTFKRRNRKAGGLAKQAVLQAQAYINEGNQYIVDIDLKSFFDEVDHAILVYLIYKKVKCKVTLQLLRRFLRAPILIEGKLHKRRKGVPQGAPLSPLLSNILLHELDKELESRGLKYVRYADDFSIYVRSKKAARRVGNGIFIYLKNRLRLPINREKSGIRRPLTFELLGYGFVSSYEKGSKGKYQLVVSAKKWVSLKAEIKRITRKTIPMTFDERVQRLNWLTRGWVNYFKHASIHGKLKRLDEWIRNRLRYCIWHHWMTDRSRRVNVRGTFKGRNRAAGGRQRKRKNLIRLGVGQDHAFEWSRTRKGGWRVAQSPILGTTITVARLKSRGYLSLLEYYHLQRSN